MKTTLPKLLNIQMNNTWNGFGGESTMESMNTKSSNHSFAKLITRYSSKSNEYFINLLDNFSDLINNLIDNQQYFEHRKFSNDIQANTNYARISGNVDIHYFHPLEVVQRLLDDNSSHRLIPLIIIYLAACDDITDIDYTSYTITDCTTEEIDTYNNLAIAKANSNQALRDNGQEVSIENTLEVIDLYLKSDHASAANMYFSANITDEKLQENPELYKCNGKIQLKLGNLDLAIANFLFYVEYAPYDQEAFKYLGNCQAILGNINEANEYYKQSYVLYKKIELIKALYEIRRGNNFNSDSRNTYKLDNLRINDSQICTTGSINKLCERFTGIHPDVWLSANNDFDIYKTILKYIAIAYKNTYINANNTLKNNAPSLLAFKTNLCDEYKEKFANIQNDGSPQNEHENIVELPNINFGQENAPSADLQTTLTISQVLYNILNQCKDTIEASTEYLRGIVALNETFKTIEYDEQLPDQLATADDWNKFNIYANNDTSINAATNSQSINTNADTDTITRFQNRMTNINYSNNSNQSNNIITFTGNYVNELFNFLGNTNNDANNINNTNNNNLNTAATVPVRTENMGNGNATTVTVRTENTGNIELVNGNAATVSVRRENNNMNVNATTIPTRADNNAQANNINVISTVRIRVM